MDEASQLDEDNFSKLLQSLGVETYSASFGWMLDDDEHGIFKWIFENISNKNALCKRESYRIAELLEEKELASSEQLEVDIENLLKKYDGLVLPGDDHGFQFAELQNKHLKAKVQLLKKQELQLDQLITKNEMLKEQVKKEVISLKHDEKFVDEELKTAYTDCIAQAEEVENKFANLIQNIAEYFKFYTDFYMDKGHSKHFLVAGPLEKYMQGRTLFRSHFDLYTKRQFQDDVRKNFNIGQNADNINIALEVKLMEERLQSAIISYVDSVARMSGMYKKIEVAVNYKEIRGSQLAIAVAEHHAEVECLTREAHAYQVEANLSKQLARMALIKDAKAKLEERKDMYDKLCDLSSLVGSATALDSFLYFALKREYSRTRDFVEFATDVKRYLDEENTMIAKRMDLMRTVQQTIHESNEKVKTNNYMHNVLKELFETFKLGKYPKDVIGLESKVDEQRARAYDILRKMETYLKKHSLLTKDLNSKLNRSIIECNGSAESFRVIRESEIELDKTIANHAKKYTDIKKNHNDPQRSLWQLFICEPASFLSAFEELENGSML